MTNILDQYISVLETGNNSKNTIRTYRKDIKKLCSFAGGFELKNVSQLKVSDFYSFYETQKHLEGSSLNGLVRSLSAFFGWLKSSGQIESTDFDKVTFGKGKFVKENPKNYVVLTDDECRNLIKAGANIQEKFMFALMLLNGLRRDEVSKIKMTDIGECSIIIHGKGNTKARIPLNEEVCTMLNAYLAIRKSDSEYLFYRNHGKKSNGGWLTGNSINNRVKVAARKAGIPEEKLKYLTAHGLRHTFGTNAIREFGIHRASLALRHKSMSTTEIYNHTGEEVVEGVIMNQRKLNISGDY